MQQIHHRYSIMAGLAIFMVIMHTSTADKGPSCCTKVSTEEIKLPILSYSFLSGKAPCVPAIVFETEKGHICSAPRKEWVLKIIKELRSLKQLALRDNSTTTRSPTTTQL